MILKRTIFCLFLLSATVESLYRGCDKEAWKWCEQSRCSKGCQCYNKAVCKQVCTAAKCSNIKCIASNACSQSIIPPTDLNGEKLHTPAILNLTAASSNIEQDCSTGSCKYVKAIKIRGVSTRALQVCVNGNCGDIVSNVDHTRQLGEKVNSMQCGGPFAKTCDQVCVLDKCKTMYCNAKDCKQRCSMGSTCSMICGDNVKTCQQICELNSTCHMSCFGADCTRNCTGSKDCKIVRTKVNNTRNNVTKDIKVLTEILVTATPTYTKEAESTFSTTQFSPPTSEENKTVKTTITDDNVTTNMVTTIMEVVKKEKIENKVEEDEQLIIRTEGNEIIPSHLNGFNSSSSFIPKVSFTLQLLLLFVYFWIL